MKQFLTLSLLCALFGGCAGLKPKSDDMPRQRVNYDYLFAKEMKPVNSDDEKAKLLERMESKKWVLVMLWI